MKYLPRAYQDFIQDSLHFVHFLGFKVTLTDTYENCYEIKNGVLLKFTIVKPFNTTAIIPSIVTHINPYVFDQCTFLRRIEMPEGVTHIGENAFFWCQSLEDINFPSTLKSIDKKAFYWCKELSFILPEGLESIGEQAFLGCKGISYLKLPNSLTTIGDSAFRACDSLYEVRMPNTSLSIGEGILDLNYKLTDIFIPHTHIMSKDQVGLLLPTNDDRDLFLSKRRTLRFVREKMMTLNAFKNFNVSPYRMSVPSTYQFEQVRAMIARSVLTQIFVREGVPHLDSRGNRIDQCAAVRIPIEILDKIADYIFFNIPRRVFNYSDIRNDTFNIDSQKASLNKFYLDQFCHESDAADCQKYLF